MAALFLASVATRPPYFVSHCDSGGLLRFIATSVAIGSVCGVRFVPPILPSLPPGGRTPIAERTFGGMRNDLCFVCLVQFIFSHFEKNINY